MTNTNTNTTTSKYASQMRYNAEKRDKLTLSLPIGTKDKWKSYAAEQGMSLTEYIAKLIENDNNFKTPFNK